MPVMTHIDSHGMPRMVDVSGKAVTLRDAEAEAILWVGLEVMSAILDGNTPKGNIFETARIAGVMGAKRTAELIPLCHQVNLSHVAVDMVLQNDSIRIHTRARTTGGTGVEMEALTAATIAALTLYDMLKALSKSLRIESVRLLSKSGGKSGNYRAEYVHD